MEIFTKQIHYYINEDELSRLNIIQGDSGTGKTSLVELTSDINLKSLGTKFIGKYPIYSLPSLDGESGLNVLKTLDRARGTHYVIIDESNSFIPGSFKHLRQALKETTHRYIVISRNFSRLDYLPIDIHNFFEITYENTKDGVTYDKVVRRFTDFHNLTTPTETQVIVVEDENSGYQFLKDYFPNIEIISSQSRTKIQKKAKTIIRELTDKKFMDVNILIVIDSLAFGFLFEGLSELKKRYDNLYLVTWKSFEEYILRSPNFIKFLRTSKCETEWDYEKSFSEYISDYNKSYLPYCIRKDGECGNPYKDIPKIKIKKNDKLVEVEEPIRDCKDCPISVTDRVQNYIHSDLQYIRESQHAAPIFNQAQNTEVITKSTSNHKTSDSEIQSF